MLLADYSYAPSPEGSAGSAYNLFGDAAILAHCRAIQKSLQCTRTFSGLMIFSFYQNCSSFSLFSLDIYSYLLTFSLSGELGENCG